MRGGHFFLTNTVDVVSQGAEGVTEILCGFQLMRFLDFEDHQGLSLDQTLWYELHGTVSVL